jgi:hypothetical protein
MGQTLDYKYQVVFVYNIAKYTQWEPEYSTGDFIIGVVGNKAISGTFEQNLNNKKIATQNIKVVNYPTTSDIKYCNILFVPASAKIDLDNLLATWGNKNILICTERDGWGKKGSMVNLITVDGKIKFELNNDSLKKSGLKLSNSITSLAIVL